MSVIKVREQLTVKPAFFRAGEPVFSGRLNDFLVDLESLGLLTRTVEGRVPDLSRSRLHRSGCLGATCSSLDNIALLLLILWLASAPALLVVVVVVVLSSCGAVFALFLSGHLGAAIASAALVVSVSLALVVVALCAG